MAAVSVILATYNGARFIREAVDSVLAQTRPADELIVVDDGSTDDTAAVLGSFGDRIRVLHQPRAGVSAARNRGIAAARGNLLGAIDDDDVWETTYLERAVACLSAQPPEVAGVIAGWVRIDSAGRPLPNTRTVLRGVLGLDAFLPQNCCPTGAVVLRREAVLAVGGFDVQLGIVQDWDLWLRLSVAGYRLAAIEECLWRYRQRPGSLSTKPIEMRDEGIRALTKVYGDPALPAALRSERARAMSYVHLHASTDLYACGRSADGDADFAAAVRTWPTLLDEDETYYATLCAEEPGGAKLTRSAPDLARAEPRLAAALAACAADLAPRAQRRAWARACRAMAQIAYAQRHMAAVRRYALRALRHDPRLWTDRGTLAPAVKSLAGASLIDCLSHRRRAARSAS